MRLIGRIALGALSLASLVLAGACILRGLVALYGSHRAGYDGMVPALGYFAAGVTTLIVSGELYNRAQSLRPMPSDSDADQTI